MTMKNRVNITKNIQKHNSKGSTRNSIMSSLLSTGSWWKNTCPNCTLQLQTNHIKAKIVHAIIEIYTNVGQALLLDGKRWFMT